MSFRRFAIAIFLLVGLIPSIALSDILQDLVSVRYRGSVARWDILTDQSDYHVSGPSSGFAAMAKLSNGQLISSRTTDSGNIPSLFAVNPATGNQTLIGTFTAGPTRLSALTATTDDQLLGWHVGLGTGDFYLVDPLTLQYQIVPITLSNGSTFHSTGSMATSPDGKIFAWTSGASASDGVFSKLFEIDIDNGTATEIGGFEQLASSDSMVIAFASDGRLFGFSDVNGGSNNGPLVPYGIYEFDLLTGSPILLRTGDSEFLGSIRGAVFVSAIPEPAGLVLWVLIIWGVGHRKLRTTS